MISGDLNTYAYNFWSTKAALVSPPHPIRMTYFKYAKPVLLNSVSMCVFSLSKLHRVSFCNKELTCAHTKDPKLYPHQLLPGPSQEPSAYPRPTTMSPKEQRWHKGNKEPKLQTWNRDPVQTTPQSQGCPRSASSPVSRSETHQDESTGQRCCQTRAGDTWCDAWVEHVRIAHELLWDQRLGKGWISSRNKHKKRDRYGD